MALFEYEAVVGQVLRVIAAPGNLFPALVKMIMMPLVLSSVVLGTSSSGDKSFLGRAASRVVPYFVMTTVVAVSIGALVATTME
ncbi:MAG: dicarboxylate/amino acid:cation symporter, partial [Deltaproteobacteria bacterium]|nr:dicarboxylate/amino acid:cation symporter [Deltaproteobacteria bacterium]